MRATLLFTSLLLSVGLSLTLFSTPVHAQDDPQANADQIQKLLVERRDVARVLVKEAKKEYLVGTKTLEVVLNANDVLLDAELDLAKTKRERINIHEQRVKNLRRVEQEIESNYKVGARVGSAAYYNSAKAARLKAEGELNDESQIDSDQIEKSQIELRATAREWVKAAEVEFQVGTKTLGDVLNAHKVLLDAEATLAKTKGDRIHLYDQHVTHLHSIEKGVKDKFEKGVRGGSAANYYSVKAARLKAEIESQVLAQAAKDQIQKLLIERRTTARKLVEAGQGEYQVGVRTLESVLNARHILLDAEMDLANTKRERIEIHEQRVKNLRRIEKEVKARYDVGARGGLPVDYLPVKAARLKAEIDLLREQEVK